MKNRIYLKIVGEYYFKEGDTKVKFIHKQKTLNLRIKNIVCWGRPTQTNEFEFIVAFNEKEAIKALKEFNDLLHKLPGTGNDSLPPKGTWPPKDFEAHFYNGF